MRRAQNIKKLAKNSIDLNGNVNSKIAEFALKKLTKEELKSFLRSLKKEYSSTTVIVRFDGNLSAVDKREIEKKHENKRIIFVKDPKITGGIEVIDNDMIVNYSVEGLLNSKFNSINL